MPSGDRDIRSIDCPGGGGKRVIIITELDSNRGPSVTNVSEHIATDVINSKGWAPADCLWVEHYATTPKRDAPATWDGINYTWMLRDGRWVASSPVWSPMSDAAAGRLAAGLEIQDMDFTAKETEEALANDLADRILGDEDEPADK